MKFIWSISLIKKRNSYLNGTAFQYIYIYLPPILVHFLHFHMPYMEHMGIDIYIYILTLIIYILLNKQIYIYIYI